ncbi:MAG: J domain-containing protein [Minwuiales bacterium]|nr:J domain-containing protein [Minwuiales bacterium]
MKDPYTTLGVSRTASQADIKKAYRKLAKELHPDRHPNDERTAERFKDVSAAYSILGDEKTRRRFDQGEINADGQQQAPGGGFWRSYGRQGGQRIDPEDFQTYEFGSGMDDLFSDLFGSMRRGGERRRPRREKGADKRFTLRIGFVEAARGGTRRLTMPDGKTLDVRIPPGIEDGQQIRLKAQGDPGPGGGPAGDALIEVTVEPHTLYTRKGLDIHVELPVTLQEAVLGAGITAPTIHGNVNLKVPKRSNTGTTLRLKGKGIHTAGDKRQGDQYVKLKVMLPQQIDDDLERLVEKWADSHAYDVRAGLKTD